MCISVGLPFAENSYFTAHPIPQAVLLYCSNSLTGVALLWGTDNCLLNPARDLELGSSWVVLNVTRVFTVSGLTSFRRLRRSCHGHAIVCRVKSR